MPDNMLLFYHTPAYWSAPKYINFNNLRDISDSRTGFPKNRAQSGSRNRIGHFSGAECSR